MDRRRFIQGAAALFCAPAIVRAESLMKIWVPPPVFTFSWNSEGVMVASDQPILTGDPWTQNWEATSDPGQIRWGVIYDEITGKLGEWKRYG